MLTIMRKIGFASAERGSEREKWAGRRIWRVEEGQRGKEKATEGKRRGSPFLSLASCQGNSGCNLTDLVFPASHQREWPTPSQ